MTATETILASRPLLLLRDGGSLREGVARRHGRRRNWARTTPRTTPTNTAHKQPQRWVEKVRRSITNSETPQKIAHGTRFVLTRAARNATITATRM